MRRLALLAIACLASLPVRADWDRAKLDGGIAALEARAQGRLGVALLDLKDRKIWSHRGDERFPMQSVFKLPLGVAVLQAVEAGTLGLDQAVTIGRRDLSLFHSPVARSFKGESATYALRELLRLAVSESDNTAADLLMRLVGGPPAVTAMLRQGGIDGISINRYEREFQPESYGLPPYRWTDTIDEARFRETLRTMDPGRRSAAMRRYLDTDTRDKATPLASATFLEALARGNWLRQPDHQALILQLAERTQAGAGRIRAGLPKGAHLAHRTGAGLTMDGVASATNDIGIVTLPDGRRFAIAIYLSGSRADAKTRDSVHAAVARLAVSALK